MFETKVVEKIKSTHFMVSNIFPENLAVSEIVSENMADTDRPQMTI